MANISNIDVSQIKTLITNLKDNLGGADDTKIIGWANFLNQFVYNEIANVNPNDFLTTQIIKTIANTSVYALPSDFKNVQLGGLYEVNSGDGTTADSGAMNFDTETVAFTTIGQTITGTTSGATGTLAEIVDFSDNTGTLRLSSVSGTFQDDELITGSTEGSATSNGTLILFQNSERKRPETGFGQQARGYWTDLTNINLTPVPKNSEILTLRYFPRLTKLTQLSDTLIIPTPDYDEFTRDSVDVFWQQWRTSRDEIQAGERATLALRNLLKTIRKTPGVMKLRRRDSIYSGRGFSTALLING